MLRGRSRRAATLDEDAYPPLPPVDGIGDQPEAETEAEAEVVAEPSGPDADLPAEVEVYDGALHGWCPPDSRVYNEAQAERAWSRLLVLFEKALA